jgi:hypothetical protein
MDMSENFFEDVDNVPDYYPQEHRGRRRLPNGDKLPYIDPSSIKTTSEEQILYIDWLEDTQAKMKNIGEEKTLEQKQRESRERSKRLSLIRGVTELGKKYDTKPPSQNPKPLSPLERGEKPDW